MSSDLIQNRFTEKRQQNVGVIANSRDFFHFLKKDNKPQARTDLHDLLRAAHTMLEKAEKDIALKSKRISDLENLLTTDELTGLTNRRGFYQHFVRELERTNRGENQGGLLIMIDLDHFKDINDTFGHLAGDKALKIVGRFLKNFMRSYDIAARLGGDEFIVLLPNTNTAQAMQRAQLLEKELNQLTFNMNGSTIHIRGSLGLREFQSGDTVESIIGAADKAMYDNKEERKSIS